MSRFCVTILSITIGIFAVQASRVYAGEDRERAIYAHYMGCFVPGSAIGYHYRTQDRDTDLTKTDVLHAQIGGRITNWPLVPMTWNDRDVEMRKAADLELRRGMRMGLKGFAIDAWAGGDGARKLFETFMEICKEKGYDFQITVCLDPSCHTVKTERYDDSAGGHVGGMYDTVRWLLSKFGDHPNLARRDGKPLIFTYSTQTFLTNELKSLGNGDNEPARWKEMLKLLQGLRDMAKKEFGTELFMHFDMDGAFNTIDKRKLKGFRPPRDPGPITAELAAYLSKGDGKLHGYDAIGGFLGWDWKRNYDIVANATISAGKEWAIPMMHQYVSRGGSIITAPGTDLMRRWWDMARKTDSTLIQYVTWNDYGEDTTLGPGTSTRYTIYDLVAHQIAWWKAGKEPTYDHDKVYMIYRRFPESAKPYPYNMRRWVPGVLEVSTILTSPATIRLPSRDISYQAPAGLYVKQFPLEPGDVSVNVMRQGKVALEVTSPDPITDKPMRGDNSIVCYSSEFERQWKLDFPDLPVENYAENGDADGDGLPNWFEMVWFGKMGDYRTATVADPNADPDKDGMTNLQEYQLQTNPTKQVVKYQTGFVWDMSTVHRNGLSLNFDPDAADRRVWQYLYRFGDLPIPLDGQYTIMTSAGRNVPYAGEMSQHTPPQNEHWKQVYGWISRHRNPDDDGWWVQLRTSKNSAVMLSWESPIAGTVSLQLSTAARKERRDRANLTIQRTSPLEVLESRQVPGNEAVKVEIPTIHVKPGDRLYIIGDGGEVMIDNIQIKLLSLSDSER